MIDSLITNGPCENCDDCGRETETGAGYCKASPSGDFECDGISALRELVAKAEASAEHWSCRIRHTPADVRREAIENESGVYYDWAEALGAEFDAAAFVAMCGVAAVVA